MKHFSRKQALAALVFAAVQSTPASAGIEVPYAQNFTSYTDFYTMEVVDANNDGNSFEYWSYKSVAQYTGNKNNADDWLLTPAIHLQPGYRYVVKATASNNYNKYTDVVEVGYCADGATVADMNIFRQATNVTGREEMLIADTIEVAADGDYQRTADRYCSAKLALRQ